MAHPYSADEKSANIVTIVPLRAPGYREPDIKGYQNGFDGLE